MTKSSAGSAARLRTGDDSSTSTASVSQRGMAVGFLAMLPLFLAYEAAIDHDGLRNSAEVVLSLPLRPFAAHDAAARLCILGACTVWAAWSCFHAELGLFQRVWRVILEGAACAVILGPLLILLLHLMGIDQAAADALRMPPPSTVPRLAEAARLVGGAAYEELVFRVGAQSLCFLVFRHVLHFFSASDVVDRFGAELLSVLASAVLFASAHLSVFVAPLGSGGETFDPAIFTWRALSGIMLSCIFRWRGPGVAAWAHALFNLALFLGAGPDCFL